MRSSRPLSLLTRATLAGLVVSVASRAGAQPATAPPTAQGFAVERLYESAPGAGWFVMDTLDMRGALGGAVALSGGYAKNPLQIRVGAQTLRVVTDDTSADFGFAVTYERWRLYLNLEAPVAVYGTSGVIGGTRFSAPSLSLGSTPDTLSDPRLGLDVRLLGDWDSPFRLGVGAQVYAPTSPRTDYDSDGTFRAMLRLLVAGDRGVLAYAGHLGVHVRPVEDASPGSPQGSELLFGGAAGVRLPLEQTGAHALVLGPEVFGETAFRSFFGDLTTGVEALASARVETTGARGAQLRLKVGVGGGLDPRFGAPDWRLAVGLELFDHTEPIEFSTQGVVTEQ